MAKIFLVDRREWKTKDRITGEPITGLSYTGFLSNGLGIQFTSKENYQVFPGEVQFDADRAIEISLITKLFGGKIKYQDGATYGKPEETM